MKKSVQGIHSFSGGSSVRGIHYPKSDHDNTQGMEKPTIIMNRLRGGNACSYQTKMHKSPGRGQGGR